MIKGELKNVHASAVVENMILAESQWFSPDHGAVGHFLRDVYDNYSKHQNNANRQAFRSRTEFSYSKMSSDLKTLLDQKLPEFPKEIKLELPKLKKIELPKRVTNG